CLPTPLLGEAGQTVRLSMHAASDSQETLWVPADRVNCSLDGSKPAPAVRIVCATLPTEFWQEAEASAQRSPCTAATLAPRLMASASVWYDHSARPSSSTQTIPNSKEISTRLVSTITLPRSLRDFIVCFSLSFLPFARWRSGRQSE